MLLCGIKIFGKHLGEIQASRRLSRKIQRVSLKKFLFIVKKLSRDKSWRLRRGGCIVGLLSSIWHSAQLGRHSCQLHVPAALYPQVNSLLLISVRSWEGHKATECGQEGLFTNSKDPIGNRTRNLPSCGSVPQPAAHLRLVVKNKVLKSLLTNWVPLLNN
jgi:hypothetical protein